MHFKQSGFSFFESSKSEVKLSRYLYFKIVQLRNVILQIYNFCISTYLCLKLGLAAKTYFLIHIGDRRNKRLFDLLKKKISNMEIK